MSVSSATSDSSLFKDVRDTDPYHLLSGRGSRLENSNDTYWPFSEHHVVHGDTRICSRSEKDFNYVFLGEEHDNLAVRKINGRLINALIKPDSILLLEGVRSMYKLNDVDKKTICNQFCISSVAQRDLTCYGWDLNNGVSLSESEQTRFIAGYRENGDPFIEEENDKSEYLKWMVEEIISIRKDILEFPSSMYPEITELNRQYREKVSKEVWDYVVETFQRRTSNMIYTLQKIEKLRKEGAVKGMVFIIAGVSHLKETKGLEDPKLSIKSFQEYLPNIPAVVAYPSILP